MSTSHSNDSPSAEHTISGNTFVPDFWRRNEPPAPLGNADLIESPNVGIKPPELTTVRTPLALENVAAIFVATDPVASVRRPTNTISQAPAQLLGIAVFVAPSNVPEFIVVMMSTTRRIVRWDIDQAGANVVVVPLAPRDLPAPDSP